jgi:hypothetical protein
MTKRRAYCTLPRLLERLHILLKLTTHLPRPIVDLPLLLLTYTWFTTFSSYFQTHIFDLHISSYPRTVIAPFFAAVSNIFEWFVSLLQLAPSLYGRANTDLLAQRCLVINHTLFCYMSSVDRHSFLWRHRPSAIPDFRLYSASSAWCKLHM